MATVFKGVVVLGLAIVLVAMFGEYMFTKLPSNLYEVFSPEYLSAEVSVASRGDAAYLFDLYPDTKLDFLWQTPLRIFYFLFSPFPSMLSEPGHVLGLVDALLYLSMSLIITVSLFRGLGIERNRLLLLLSVLFVFVFVFSWGTSNFGTAIRHRQKIAWLFITLTSIGMYNLRIGWMSRNKSLGKNEVEMPEYIGKC